MVLFGTLVNAILVVIGALIGRFFQNMPDKMKETVMGIIGIAIVLLGIQMGFSSSNFIVITISLVVGTILGEWLDIESKFRTFGQKLESLFGKKNVKGSIAEGFVTATLIFCIGSMAVIGALDSGLRNEHNVLITKGIIDGFMSIILSSTLGIGVALAAVPIFLYQGIIALSSGFISEFIPQEVLDIFVEEMTATGGVLIMAIGLNVLGITKIRVANLLPALFVVGVVVAIIYMF